MKKIIIFLLLAFFALSALSQEGHKLNADIDMSFGLHYFDSKINNPLAGGVSIGYEYDINMLFGIEAGFRIGGFNQKAGYNDSPNISRDVYKGMYWAPYIAPKIYVPIGYDEKHDRARFLFLENRFSLTHINLDMDKITNMEGNVSKNRFMYEIRAGYQYPINGRWAITGWVGYNTFDFSKVKPKVIKHKNSTPFQIGIGFNFIIKQ